MAFKEQSKVGGKNDPNIISDGEMSRDKETGPEDQAKAASTQTLTSFIETKPMVSAPK